MASVIGLKYKHPEIILAVIDEDAPIMIEQDSGNNKTRLKEEV